MDYFENNFDASESNFLLNSDEFVERNLKKIDNLLIIIIMLLVLMTLVTYYANRDENF